MRDLTSYFSLCYSQLLYIVVALVTLWVFLIRKHGRRRDAQNLPPGPKALPVIGNLHQIGALPHRGLAKLAKKWGPIMYVKMGSVPVVIISSSEAAKLVLKTQDSFFVDRPVNSVADGHFFNPKGLILATYGDDWRIIRKTCVLQLFTAKKVSSFLPTMDEEITTMSRSLWEESNHGTLPINVENTFKKLVSSFSLRILGGRNFAERHDQQMREILDEIPVLCTSPADLVPFLLFFDLLRVKKRSIKIKERIHSIFDGVIAERRGNGKEDDMVNSLLNMVNENTDSRFTLQHVKEIMLDLYIAATDTTTTSLTWAMVELIKNPRVLKKVETEMEQFVGEKGEIREESLAKLKYLDCVIKESLRLHAPAVLGVFHQPLEEVTLMGYKIPAKTRVMINLWAIGRDEAVWQDSLVFKPERFMERGDIDMTGHSDFKMIPFGAGRRGCPGFPIALSLMKLCLARVVREFTWALEGGLSLSEMGEKAGITVGPRESLWLVPRLKVGVNNEKIHLS